MIPKSKFKLSMCFWRDIFRSLLKSRFREFPQISASDSGFKAGSVRLTKLPCKITLNKLPIRRVKKFLKQITKCTSHKEKRIVYLVFFFSLGIFNCTCNPGHIACFSLYHLDADLIWHCKRNKREARKHEGHLPIILGVYS